MEKQTNWIKSKMTTTLSEETVSKLIELVEGLPEETNVNNVSKLLVYLIETEPAISTQVNPVNVKETEVYIELINKFTELETKYSDLVSQPAVNVEETEVYQGLLDRFTKLETSHKESKETIVNIKETEVYRELETRFTELETKYTQLSKKPAVNVKETAVYLALEKKFTALETAHNQLLKETTKPEKKETTFFWEG